MSKKHQIENFSDELLTGFYPYIIPNGIFTKTGKQNILLGAARYQISVGVNPNNTWVASHTGRNFIINENIYPYIIPHGIFTKTISENFKQLT